MRGKKESDDSDSSGTSDEDSSNSDTSSAGSSDSDNDRRPRQKKTLARSSSAKSITPARAGRGRLPPRNISGGSWAGATIGRSKKVADCPASPKKTNKPRYHIDIAKIHPKFYLPCLKKVADQLGYVELFNSDKEPAMVVGAKGALPERQKVDMFWHDRLDVPLTRYMVGRLGPKQRINRFYKMLQLAKKNPLARVLNRLAKLYPEDYCFHPTSYEFPVEVPAFKQLLRAPRAGSDGGSEDEGSCDSDRNDDFYIIKPSAGCKGRGIKICRRGRVLSTWARMRDVPGEEDAVEEKLDARVQETQKQAVVQCYLRPYLLGGHKFDFRLYVVVLGVNPLRAYLCRTGMVRRCMVPYQEPTAANIKIKGIHLTNTAVNSSYAAESSSSSGNSSGSGSEDDTSDEDDYAGNGCKRLMTDVFQELKSEGVDTHYLWEGIKRVVSLTMNAIHPELCANYVSCFQLSEVNSEMARRVLAKRRAHRLAAASISRSMAAPLDRPASPMGSPMGSPRRAASPKLLPRTPRSASLSSSLRVKLALNNDDKEPASAFGSCSASTNDLENPADCSRPPHGPDDSMNACNGAPDGSSPACMGALAPKRLRTSAELMKSECEGEQPGAEQVPCCAAQIAGAGGLDVGCGALEEGELSGAGDGEGRCAQQGPVGDLAPIDAGSSQARGSDGHVAAANCTSELEARRAMARRRMEGGSFRKEMSMKLFSGTVDGTRCFQIIGFDVMLDEGANPFVIEINHNPSFKLPTPLDEDIKTAAMAGAVALASDFPMTSKCAAAKRAAVLYEASKMRERMEAEEELGFEETPADSEQDHETAAAAHSSSGVKPSNTHRSKNRPMPCFAPSIARDAIAPRALELSDNPILAAIDLIEVQEKELVEKQKLKDHPPDHDPVDDPDGTKTEVYSSRDWAVATWYDPLPSVSPKLEVFDRARLALEALCSEAIADEAEQSRTAGEEEARNRLASASAPQGDAPDTPVKIVSERSKDGALRHVGSFILLNELPEKHYPVLIRTLSRVRLPRACSHIVKGDGTLGHRSQIKALFPTTRTPVSVVLTADSFFDGLVVLSEIILKACTDTTGQILPEIESSEIDKVLLPEFTEEWQQAASKPEALGSVLHQLISRILQVLIGTENVMVYDHE